MIEKKFKPEGYDIHPNGALKLSALMKYMQAAATADTEKYGSDYSLLRSNNMIFVVYQTAIELNRLSPFPNTVTVKTWQRAVEGVRFIRDYAIDIEGSTACATNTWTLINFKTRRIMRPTALIQPIPSFIDMTQRAKIEKLPQIERSTMQYAGKYKVNYSQLDANGHVNNTVYSDIVFDYAPLDISTMQPNYFNIIYAGEAKSNDMLDIYTFQKDTGFILSAYAEDTNKKVFEAEISLLQI